MAKVETIFLTAADYNKVSDYVRPLKNSDLNPWFCLGGGLDTYVHVAGILYYGAKLYTDTNEIPAFLSVMEAVGAEDQTAIVKAGMAEAAKAKAAKQEGMWF